MAKDFNIGPYYDDFDQTKNYHRILFKPGYAVQARELTQSQTILQDQISKFGLGIYKDGSKVSGGNISIDTKIATVKILNNTQISSFVGLYAVGTTSTFIMNVTKVDNTNYYVTGKPINVANGQEFSSGETINFYTTKEEALSSLNSSLTPLLTATVKTETTLSVAATGTQYSDILTIQTLNISVGDIIEITSIKLRSTVVSIIDTGSLQISDALPQNISNITSTITQKVSVKALEFNIDSGVWFTDGIFVSNQPTSYIPDVLSAYPSVVMGFDVVESIVNSYNDPSLLDPAIGASNYQAPGADRYSILLNVTSKPYINQQTVADLTTDKFIELARIHNGALESVNKTPVFSELGKTLAQTVYDQSGNFIVNPFSLNIGDSASASGNITSFISSGKAYINGYPTEHITPTTYVLEKARDTDTETNADIVSYYGNYVVANNFLGGIIDFQTAASINLHNVVASSASSANRVGTARVRNFSYDSGSGSSTHYQVFLFDIKLTGDTFSNVKSLVTTTGNTNIVQTAGVTQLIDANYDSLVFPTLHKNLQTVSNVNYVTTRRFAGQIISGNFVTITINSPETFVGEAGALPSTIAKQNYFVVKDGAYVPLDTYNGLVSLSNSNRTATINVGSGSTADIYTTISITGGSRKSKTSNTDVGVVVDASSTSKVALDIGYSDIYKFNGIYLTSGYSYVGKYNAAVSYVTNNMVTYNGTAYISITNSLNQQPNTNASAWSAATDISSLFTTDNGQRDAYYDHGYVTNVSGVSQGNVLVAFDYFKHSSGYGYFDVDSYDVDYADIPSFVSPQYGTSYNLRDVIDFRPRRTDGATTFDSFQLPAPPGSSTFADYSYYLSRNDKIVLYPNGQFKTIRGISSYINPITPSDVPDALTLFTLKNNAYTFTKDDIAVTPTNLRRYTMRDIGVLDKRITNLEYYTTLSLSESEVSGQTLTDSTGTNILHKAGFLVDGFKGQGVGDVGNPDYAVSIDFTNKLCRPLFSSDVAEFYVDPNQGKFTTGKTNNLLTIKDNLVTFSYDEVPFITQKVACDIINVNPFNVINFIGEFKLSPSSDVWYDTQSKPIINIVNEDQAAWQAAVNGTGNGTQWNDWNINWTGQNLTDPNDQGQVTRDTQAIQDAISSKGLTGALTSGDIQVSSTTQVVATSIIPYCRSIPVRFEIKGMPPFTELFTFLNGNIVNSYIAPDASSTDGVWYIKVDSGGTLNSNTQITVTGNNTIPAIAWANVSSSNTVVSAYIQQAGAGYQTPPTLSVPGGVGVSLSVSSTGAIGAPLVTNKNGYASGIIYIPNDSLLKIPTGTVFVEFSDQPFIGATNGAYASSTFYAKGTLNTLQTTVVSTRPPSYTVKPVIPPVLPVADSGPSWTNDALSPGAASLTYDYVKNEIYNYLYYRAIQPGGIRVIDVDRFYAANGFQLIYDQLVTSFGANPTVAMMAGFALKAIQIDRSVPGVNAASAIVKVKNLIIKTAKQTNQNTALVDANQLKKIENNAKNAKIAKRTLNGMDPLSQNFYVTSLDYPNGLFLSSVDLFFVSKDPNVPVSVRIRPTVNGFPDSVNDIPGSIVFKNPDDISVPVWADREKSIGSSTRFTFDHPIYLAPGEYSIMIMADSNQYNLYESKKGLVEFGTQNPPITGPTYVGSLFKSQNSTTWVPSTEGESLCFVLNRCDFAGGTVSFDATSNNSTLPIYYDLLQVTTNDLTFADSDLITYSVLTKNADTGSQSTLNIVPNDNINFASRQIQNTASDIIVRPTLTNINRYTSPVVDLERLNTILVKNIISSYNVSTSTSSESLGGFKNGNAVARYITRRVTLNDNFDSSGLTVYFDVQRPPGTSVEVYYKVLNQSDSNNFDDQLYVKMPAILTSGSGVSTTTPTTWTTDTYQSTGITYTDIKTNVTYNSFKTFAIKVVFYSSNPSFVPQIKNFRAIASI